MARVQPGDQLTSQVPGSFMLDDVPDCQRRHLLRVSVVNSEGLKINVFFLKNSAEVSQVPCSHLSVCCIITLEAINCGHYLF